MRAPTMIRFLEEECARARKRDGWAYPPAVAWIQLDDSPNHRDQLGFSGLERLMHAIHERARSVMAERDTSARFGLDAIAVLMDSGSGDRDFRAPAEAVVQAIAGQLLEFGEHSVAATVSMAVAPVRESLVPAEANLVQVARQAERLSAGGGNRAHFVDATTGRDTPGSLLGRLTKALRDDSVKVVYQPLLATSGPEHERLQLLPRLVGPDGQLIPAARFIPIAAERGVLPALDHWMIGHAVELLRARVDAGGPAPTLFINQSPALVDDAGFLGWVAERVDDLEAGQRNLVLEFAIGDLKPRIRAARDALARLRELGIGVSLTGIDERIPEAVLLEHLPADFLRMKADFARRVLADDSLAARFERFAEAARAADRKLIVPMLEDADEVSRIWRMNVDLIQGNFIQQPSETPLEA